VQSPVRPALRAPIPQNYPIDNRQGPPPPEAAAALDNWWRLYDDPQLEALIDTALANSPDALIAKSRLDEARATNSTALMPFRPQGAITGDDNAQHTHKVSGNVDLANVPVTVPLVPIGNTSGADADFQVSWEVDLFGRRRAAAKVAVADLAAARFEYEGARASLAASVADDLFQARELAVETDLALETQADLLKLDGVIREKVASGFAPQSELDDVEARLANARAHSVDLASQLESLKRTLLVLIGRGTDPSETLSIRPEVTQAPSIPPSAPGDLLERRPDIRLADARVQAALGRTVTAKLDLFPTIDFLRDTGITEVSRPGNSYATSMWSLGLGMTIPVLDRPRLIAEIKAQDARAAGAVDDYEKTVQAAFGETANVLNQLAADERQEFLLEDAERHEEAACKSAINGYRNGLNDQETVFSAEEAYRSARLSVQRAKAESLRRSVQAFKALGGGWETSAAVRMARAAQERG
jgi:NodT family efflux transporter outer membrane factor (OMF) lipoprotein